jgi:hypothetical protein
VSARASEASQRRSRAHSSELHLATSTPMQHPRPEQEVVAAGPRKVHRRAVALGEGHCVSLSTNAQRTHSRP